MSSEEFQQALVRSWAALEDLRRRNGELTTALQEHAPEAFELITPAIYRSSRAALLNNLFVTAIAWSVDDCYDEDLKESIRSVVEFLPDWAKRLESDREKGKRAAAKREAKKSGKNELSNTRM